MKKAFIIILILLLTNCVNNQKKEKITGDTSSMATDTILESKDNTKIKSEDVLLNEEAKSVLEPKDSFLVFNKFLDRFSKDSIFRYSRINFPLAGYNSDAETDKDNYKWGKKEWDFYSKIDLKYKKDNNIISKIISNDSIMTWRLYTPNSGYDINYHFKLKGTDWFLNYYSYKNY